MKNCPVCKHESVALERDGYWRCQNCSAYQKRMSLSDKIYQWAQDRSVIARFFLVGLIVLLLLRLLANDKVSLSGFSNPFGYFDLGFHELGHLVFLPLGEFMTIAGGSIFQVVIPIAWLLTFFFKRWYFAATVCLAWLGSSLFGVSVYARDASLTELPLVSLGNIGDSEASGHDWEYLFGQTGNISAERVHGTADLIKHTGAAALILSILLGLALCSIILRMKYLARKHKKHIREHTTPADELYPTATKGVLADAEPVKEQAEENRPDSSKEE